MSPEMDQRLVAMANQIAGALESQGAGAAAATAAHIRRYWAASMRGQLISFYQAGRPGLAPIAVEAVRQLAELHG